MVVVQHFQGIAVDAGVCVDGDCAITHMVSGDAIEIDFGHATGSLHLCLSQDAAVKLVNVVTVAVADLQEHRATLDRSGRVREQR